MNLLTRRGAKLAGISALPFFSDLAFDTTHLHVMVDSEELAALEGDTRATWHEASWSENAALVVETWTYPLDASSQISLASTGLACVDPHSLYAELINDRLDNVRVTDTIEQLRELICRQ